MSRRKPRAEAHVRLYRHEIECDAYRSLSPEARALLVELRALYSGAENRVFMSRDAMVKRLGVGRFRADNARDELIDRGFVRLLSKGAFSRKTRHASEFALTNEPITRADGAVAPKDFMRWSQKNTGLLTSTNGVNHQPRGNRTPGKRHASGATHQPREPHFQGAHGATHQPTDKLPSGKGDSVLATLVFTDPDIQFRAILSGLLVAQPQRWAA